MAIVDPDLALTMPPKLTAHTGMDAITHAIEAYVSTLYCDYTDPLALHAIKMIGEYITASYKGDAGARGLNKHAVGLSRKARGQRREPAGYTRPPPTGGGFTRQC